MFGYITINKPELKVRDYEVYRSYYCGLCRTLDREHGPAGRLTLSYDMTFLVILLTALYEPENTIRERRCIPHPVHKHRECYNEFSSYVADMNLLLTYYKLEDDWKDEKKILKLAGAEALKGKIRKIEAAYPEISRLMRENLEKITSLEKEQDPGIDNAAGFFGEIMAELFAPKKDMWQQDLKEMGFYLGKFIYLMDAYDDRKKDQETGNYNVFLLNPEMKEEQIREILTMMMGASSRAFERLPILEHGELLRNILYSGVWSRYSALQEGKK